MTNMIKVACRIPNGIMLQLFRPGYDDGTGKCPAVKDGLGVRLNGPSALHAGLGNTAGSEAAGITLVDAAWFETWREQNKTTNAVTMNQIYEIKDGDPVDPNPEA